LIAFYDDNGISIDGEVEGWFTDDTPKRFEAYGWQVIANVDGHDSAAIAAAIDAAKADSARPTIICCKTIIGKGSPNKQGKEDCHGAALGEAEVALVRETLGWSHPPFFVPSDVYAGWSAKAKGAELEKNWNERFDAYAESYPDLALELARRLSGDLPEDFAEQANAYIRQLQEEGATIASRKASQNAINAFAPLLPEMLGGSADLAGSNLTLWSGSKGVTAADASGNYLYYGVREFGMSAMMNGIALHGGFVPYGATFLMFMEYARNAVRMAALMRQRVLFVYTHDSIGLGEDGPTHQPVEQLTSLRSTPNLDTWRPCDAVESAVSWKAALERSDGPSALIFSRQNLVHQPRNDEQLANIARGAYILSDCDTDPDAIIIATGSEVQLAIDAKAVLEQQGRKIRVVSMPSTSVFDAQDVAYREAVLPSNVLPRVAVEAGHKDFWYKYVGLDGRIVGMETFGESAPINDLMEHFGFTVEAVVEAVEDSLG
jgi:transketolase